MERKKIESDNPRCCESTSSKSKIQFVICIVAEILKPFHNYAILKLKIEPLHYNLVKFFVETKVSVRIFRPFAQLVASE